MSGEEKVTDAAQVLRKRYGTLHGRREAMAAEQAEPRPPSRMEAQITHFDHDVGQVPQPSVEEEPPDEDLDVNKQFEEDEAKWQAGIASARAMHQVAHAAQVDQPPGEESPPSTPEELLKQAQAQYMAVMERQGQLVAMIARTESAVIKMERVVASTVHMHAQVREIAAQVKNIIEFREEQEARQREEDEELRKAVPAILRMHERVQETAAKVQSLIDFREEQEAAQQDEEAELLKTVPRIHQPSSSLTGDIPPEAKDEVWAKGMKKRPIGTE